MVGQQLECAGGRGRTAQGTFFSACPLSLVVDVFFDAPGRAASSNMSLSMSLSTGLGERPRFAGMLGRALLPATAGVSASSYERPCACDPARTAPACRPLLRRSARAAARSWSVPTASAPWTIACSRVALCGAWGLGKGGGGQTGVQTTPFPSHPFSARKMGYSRATRGFSRRNKKKSSSSPITRRKM